MGLLSKQMLNLTIKHMEQKVATPWGLANSLRPRRSGLLGDRSENDEEAQGSSPGKRPPVVGCAITLNLYRRVYRKNPATL